MSNKLVFIIFTHIFLFCFIFFLFKLLRWMVTLLLAVGLERITPKYTPLICDKSATTQNSALLSYLYRKKRL